MTENTLITFLATITLVAAIVVASNIIQLFLLLSSNQGEAIDTFANCIAATAKAEGYTGNVHGEEAWRLFADKCR